MSIQPKLPLCCTHTMAVCESTGIKVQAGFGFSYYYFLFYFYFLFFITTNTNTPHIASYYTNYTYSNSTTVMRAGAPWPRWVWQCILPKSCSACPIAEGLDSQWNACPPQLLTFWTISQYLAGLCRHRCCTRHLARIHQYGWAEWQCHYYY